MDASQDEVSQMINSFYRTFEEKHRGGRDLIKSRLRVYLPFVECIKSIYSNATAVDLGCGRGEWLELLREVGINALGVDVDIGMLEACQELGLNVRQDDAITFLKALPDESQTVVSGFHLAEHIAFADLQILVQESLRVLKPAGLLILETPNSENIRVGTSLFYIDPTHRNPIHSELLAFIPTYYGFARVKTLRLQETVKISDRYPNLMDVIAGVSPDYSVIAQKPAEDEYLAVVNELFSQSYGATLEDVTARYQHHLAELLESVDSALKSRTRTLEERIYALEVSLSEILNSRSWRLTASLRWVGHFVRAGKERSKQMLLSIIALVIARPKLKKALVKFLNRLPRLKHRLALLTVANNPVQLVNSRTKKVPQLSRRASQILSDLKQAMGKE